MGDNNKGQTIFLSIIGIATLLVAIIGATFAYFTTTMDGGAQNVSATTAKLGTVEFEAEPMVITDKVLPGWNATKNVTVTMKPSDYDVDYKCQLVVTSNDITDLYVTATSDNTDDTIHATDKQLASGDAGAATVDLVSGTLKASTSNVTRNITYKLEFKETGELQNTQQGKSIAATVSCSLDGETVYYNAKNPTGTTNPTDVPVNTPEGN